VTLARDDVYLTLRDPSGRSMSPGAGGPRPDLTFGPLPGDPEGCRGEVDALRARLATAQADAEADMRPDRRYEKSAPNPRLTAETNAIVRRVFGGDGAAPLADCRGIVCKMSGPQPFDGWRRRLEEDADFRIRTERAMCCAPILFVMKTPEQLAATLWLRKLGDAFVAGPAPAACDKEHRAQGTLIVTLKLPATGQTNEDGLPGRLTARYGGPLADTPLAHCIAAELARTVLATTPPSPTAAASASRRLQFPIAPPAFPRPLR
jgi:hypothetical protein